MRNVVMGPSSRSSNTDKSPPHVVWNDRYRCAMCCQFLEGRVTCAMDQFWCQNHFTCALCNALLLDDSYSVFNEKQYCNKCFQTVRPKCTACLMPVKADEEYIAFMKYTMHCRCFRCSRCKEKLNPAGFVYDNDKFMCKSCALRFLAKKSSGSKNSPKK